MFRKWGLFILLICAAFLISGCSSKSQENTTTEAPVLTAKTMKPEQRKISDYATFTGRLRSIDEIDVRPQISGILSKVCFTEGAEVKKDQLLFEISPEIFQAEYDAAVGELERLKVQEVYLKTVVDRTEALYKKGAESEESRDSALNDYKMCQANILTAQANKDKCQANLGYTKIYSPVDGYARRLIVTEGNCVQANSNTKCVTLVNIVSMDPLYVYFDIDETTFLTLRKRAEKEGREGVNGQEIRFRLSDETNYENVATIKFSDPSINISTGTQTLRAVCENPKDEHQNRKFTPGMMVTVRIPVKENYDALLVPESCLGTDQGRKFVYLRNKEGKVEMRHVQLGALQDDLMRSVVGLNPDDEVILDNLLKMRPGEKVEAAETNEKIQTNNE